MVFFENMGLLALTPGMVFMWLIGFTLIYLAITRQYEPLLLLPIGFGIILTNLPLALLMEPGEGLLWRFYHYGIEWEVIPPLIFLGLGAMTDFGSLLSQPRLIFLGAAAQVGVYVTFFIAYTMGFSLQEAATIGIIGGADGPTTIYLAAKLAPQLLGACAVAAYSYMALVPMIMPPIMKLLTTDAERDRCHGHHTAGTGFSAPDCHVHDGQPVPRIQSCRTPERHGTELTDEYRHNIPRRQCRGDDERRKFSPQGSDIHFLPRTVCIHDQHRERYTPG
jgi:hypothetical protein